jgi:uncharacterized membrane protein YkoI
MKKQLLLLTTITTAGIILAASPLKAEEPDGKKSPIQGTLAVAKSTPERDYPTLAKVPLLQAVQTAVATQPGTPIEAKLTRENGFLVWRMDVVSAKGDIYEVTVDAGSGKALASAIDYEDEENE